MDEAKRTGDCSFFKGEFIKLNELANFIAVRLILS